MTGKPLQDRVALVTGASRGIGAAVARGFAKAGAQVILLARTQGALEEIDDAIRRDGGAATLMPFDLSRPDELEKIGAAIAAKFGRLDILAGNAGMLGTLGPLAHMKPREWDKVMTVNLHANVRLLRACDGLLRASDAGRVIFTTSGLAQKPLAYWGAYCASKAALEMMTKVYAAEMLEATKVRANLVDPGIVDTAILREAFPGGYQGVTGKPEDAVPAFLELASPACARSGEVVRVR